MPVLLGGDLCLAEPELAQRDLMSRFLIFIGEWALPRRSGVLAASLSS
jgi:hypothetical protein